MEFHFHASIGELVYMYIYDHRYIIFIHFALCRQNIFCETGHGDEDDRFLYSLKHVIDGHLLFCFLSIFKNLQDMAAHQT